MTSATPAVMGDKPLVADVIAQAIAPIEIYDIGAMSEGQERFARLVSQNLASVNGFEPNPVEYARLRALNAPQRRYFPYFLGQGGLGNFSLDAISRLLVAVRAGPVDDRSVSGHRGHACRTTTLSL